MLRLIWPFSTGFNLFGGSMIRKLSWMLLEAISKLNTI